MSIQRLQWMDFVRGVCILLVILVHTGSAMTRANVPYSPEIDVFNEFFGPFRMPLLMFLSGLLLHKSLTKSNKEYVLGKFYLIFWPFIVWSMAVYAADGRLTLEYILKTPISAPSLLWYLWFLCAYYLIALVLERFRVPILPVILICLVASGFLPSIMRMDRFAALFVFFLLGHYAVREKLSLQGRWPIAFLGLGAAVIGGVISATGVKIKYDPFFVWVPVGLTLFILWAAPLYSSSRIGGGIEWIGRNSIVFYVAHFPVLTVMARVMAETTALDGALFYATLFLIAVAVSAALQILRNQNLMVAALFDFRFVLRLFGRPGEAATSPRKF